MEREDEGVTQPQAFKVINYGKIDQPNLTTQIDSSSGSKETYQQLGDDKN